MANVFDSDDAFEGAPRSFVVGDFVQWKRSDLVSDYPPDSYSMEIVARKIDGGGDEIKIAATETDTYYLFSVSSSTSADYIVGKYRWHLEVTKTASGDRAVIDRGEFEVLADIDETTADVRTHAEIMVDKIESLLEGRADSDVSNYAIKGRSLTRMDVDELTRWRDYYRAEVAREQSAKNPNSAKTTVKVRFNGAI